MDELLGNGVKLRPHYKSHKCAAIAHRQIEWGAVVITGERLFTSVEKIIKPRPFKYENTLSYVIPGMLDYFDYYELMQ